MEIKDFLVAPECSVLEAMRQINRNTKGIVYVCKQEKLIGTVTDGDIRRYILKNGDLRDSVTKVVNMDAKVLYESEKCLAKEQMKRYKISSIPILDKYKRIKEICFAEECVRQKKSVLKVPVVIMAGGKGTRLYPYTQILPKPLIPIGDKTITEHIIERFMDYGCSQFDMIVNYKKNFIKSYFLDNENPININFIEETEFLGTGGGLRLLEGRYPSTFFMSNCDILITEDYGAILKFHQEQNNIITMVCASKRLQIPYGTVEFTDTGKVLQLKEKPEISFMTNTGLYVLEPEFLKEIPENTFIHITDVIQKCIDKGKNVGVYPIPEENWLDMGQMDELKKMKESLENRL